VKKTSLELGGNAPFVVLADADLDAAIEGALRSKFRNGGQTCVCAQRFIVHASLADRFAEGLADRAERLKIGMGSDPATEVGPMINQDAVEKVERHVTDALAKGARRVTGGKRAYPDGTPTNGTGTFYAPTVLANCDASMAVHREETFGPVAAVFSFETEREAIAMANDSDSGLAGYVYTRDGEAMWRVAEALECGIVGANTGAVSVAAAPFGGVKESGIGREGGRQGIDEYLEVKYLCMNNTAPKKA
jgi:succinate-semialdehyde dehydrogenase/glutarate-semialdehyde dehydrogenase